MSNIFGETIALDIQRQIELRQKVYGSGYASSRTPDQSLYLNGNTSWCKLVSGVNVNNTNELAKRYPLFNSTSPNTNILRGGISFNNSIHPEQAAYGIGGNEFGINAPMGIISATINYENRGSIRKANIKIKAFNKTQFEIIDILYLRLGFSVLLEWGNSMYFDDKGELKTDLPFHTLDYRFLNPGTTANELLSFINLKRLETFGNYDAMFAKVTNFHWSFLPNGTYSITLNLVSVGDIVESFKIKGSTDNDIKLILDTYNHDHLEKENVNIVDLVFKSFSSDFNPPLYYISAHLSLMLMLYPKVCVWWFQVRPRRP